MKILNYYVKNRGILWHYYLAKLAYQISRYHKLLNKDPVVIYQMGKVGSTSILHSMQPLNEVYQIFQVHSLSANGIHKMEKLYWGNTPKLLRRSLLPETRHIFDSHFLRRQWSKGGVDKYWRFITLVRDPIARNVSEFFYSVDTSKDDPYIPNFYGLYQAKSIKVSDLIEFFQSRFHPDSEEFVIPLTWFDMEINTVLNTDVYTIDFPKINGFQIIKNRHFEILIIKLEKLNNCVQKAFSEFLNLDKFRLTTANQAAGKQYYPLYKEFIRNIQLSDNYVNKMYNTKYMKHFYSDDEIEGFRRKWQKRT